MSLDSFRFGDARESFRDRGRHDRIITPEQLHALLDRLGHARSEFLVVIGVASDDTVAFELGKRGEERVAFEQLHDLGGGRRVLRGGGASCYAEGEKNALQRCCDACRLSRACAPSELKPPPIGCECRGRKRESAIER